MAGMGSRLRPHTLTVPKPLIVIAGKTIIERLVEEILTVCDSSVEEIAFIIGDFGEEVEQKLIQIAKKLGVKGKIYYQDKPLGTAHAILCAKESLDTKVVIAFADTLFKANFLLDKKKDGVVWIKKVEDPSSFGVVKINKEKTIIDFFEKPEKFISNLAIIGIYYFNNAKKLKKELQYLLDNNIKEKGEFQLTNALENMKNKGAEFSVGKVKEWLDCGNKNATVNTNKKILELYKKNKISSSAEINNSEIIEPCFIGEKVKISNSKIGPYVSVERETTIQKSIISKTIIQKKGIIKNAKLNNSMIGSFVVFDGKDVAQEISLGDYSEVK